MTHSHNDGTDPRKDDVNRIAEIMADILHQKIYDHTKKIKGEGKTFLRSGNVIKPGQYNYHDTRAKKVTKMEEKPKDDFTITENNPVPSTQSTTQTQPEVPKKGEQKITAEKLDTRGFNTTTINAMLDEISDSKVDENKADRDRRIAQEILKGQTGNAQDAVSRRVANAKKRKDGDDGTER